MSEQNQTASHDRRITRLEGVVEGVSKQIEALISHQEIRDKQQETRDSALFRKLDEAKEATRPNVATWIAGLGLVAVIIFGIYSPFAAGLNDRVENAKAQAAMADRLQLEQVDNLKSRLDSIEQWQTDQMRSDLNELRERRLRDSVSHNPTLAPHNNS